MKIHINFKSFLKWPAICICAAITTLSVQTAEASSLGLIPGPKQIAAVGATTTYGEAGSTATFSALMADVTSSIGITPGANPKLSFSLPYELTPDMSIVVGLGGFDLIDDDGLFLSGTLTNLGWTTGVIEAVFDGISGSAAGDMGDRVLMQIAFIGSQPIDNDDPLWDAAAFDYNTDVTLSSVVPLPPALLLFASGLGLLFSRKRFAILIALRRPWRILTINRRQIFN